MNCSKSLNTLYYILLQKKTPVSVHWVQLYKCYSSFNQKLPSNCLNFVDRKLLSNKNFLPSVACKYSIEANKKTEKTINSNDETTNLSDEFSNKTDKSSEAVKLSDKTNEGLLDGPGEKSTNGLSDDKVDEKAPKKSKSALAKVFAEYGVTAVLFHTTISLTSLGISYTLVSSGIDMVALLQKFNINGEYTAVAGGATTFVVAYACHKVFMPVRAFITITCTPLIVKKLRGIGFLKSPSK